MRTAPFFVGRFIREGIAMVAYKLFKLKKKYPGQLFPLYVLSNEPVPMGVWLPAKEGPRTADGRVKSRLGPLCFRPGWHMSELPLAIHIGIKVDGEIRYMHDDEVWCECEYSDGISYQAEADANARVNGDFIQIKRKLERIPVGGYYRSKTSPMMLGEWIIAGEMKVQRVLDDEEVADICRQHGYEPLPRRKPLERELYGLGCQSEIRSSASLSMEPCSSSSYSFDRFL